MIRKAFYMKLIPGMLEKYRKAHNPIPEDLATTLKAHGIHNYSIFHHKESGLLCAYMEIEDPKLLAHLTEHECCCSWWRVMCNYLVKNHPNDAKAREEEMTEVFHLD